MPIANVYFDPKNFPPGGEKGLGERIRDTVRRGYEEARIGFCLHQIGEVDGDSDGFSLEMLWPYNIPISLQGLAVNIADEIAHFANAGMPDVLRIEVHLHRNCMSNPEGVTDFDRKGYVVLTRSIFNPAGSEKMIFPVQLKP